MFRNKLFKSRLIRRTFIWSTVVIFGLIYTISSLQLSVLVETGVLALLIITLFFVVERFVDNHVQKSNNTLLLQLVNELNIGHLNIENLHSLGVIKLIVNHLKEFNLKGNHFQEALYSKLGLGMVEFGEDLIINSANVGALGYLFEQSEAAGKSVIEFLFNDASISPSQKQNCEFHLVNVMGMNQIQWKISSSSFIRELELVLKGSRFFLRLHYIPIFENQLLTHIHIIIQDFTEHKRAQSQAVRREQEIEKIFALLQVSDSLFELFMDETRALFDEIKQDLKRMKDSEKTEITKISNRMFRNVHTIKANSKLFKLNSIEEVAHEVESYLADLKDEKVSFSTSAYRELTRKVMAISEEIYSYASLRKEILSSFDRKKDQNLKYRIQWIRSLLNQFAFILRDPEFEPRHLKSIQKEFGRALSSFDKISLKDYISGYDSMLHDISIRLNKKLKPIEAHLESHYFEGVVLARINDVVVHCLRNAVDHGIENPEQRLAQGKTEEGVIKICSVERNGYVNISIEDDGRGINLDKVKQKAIDNKLISVEQAPLLNESQVIELLFEPGFSTAEEVSHISGRGLGMDAARDTARQLHGELTIRNSPGKGTKFFLQIPSNTEEYLAPSSIFNLKETTMSVVHEFDNMKSLVALNLSMDEAYAFGDRWSIMEIMRQALREIFLQAKQRGEINIEMQSHLGRRRVDSHNFYRFLISIKSDLCGTELTMSPAFSKLASRLEKICGSLIMRNQKEIELNIPSNIPVPFSHYKFTVALFCRESQSLQKPIENFFRNLMANWEYDLIVPQDHEGANHSMEVNKPCIVILDGHSIDRYISVRSENCRRQDGMLFLTSEDTEIETLNNTSVLPENIMFAPASMENNSFDRGLASIILRRFLKEMVKNSHELSDRDLEIVGKFAG